MQFNNDFGLSTKHVKITYRGPIEMVPDSGHQIVTV